MIVAKSLCEKRAPLGECNSRTLAIADVIETQAERWPDHPAMFALGRQPLSFASLVAHAKTIRGQLNELGIGQGTTQVANMMQCCWCLHRRTVMTRCSGRRMISDSIVDQFGI